LNEFWLALCSLHGGVRALEISIRSQMFQGTIRTTRYNRRLLLRLPGKVQGRPTTDTTKEHSSTNTTASQPTNPLRVRARERRKIVGTKIGTDTSVKPGVEIVFHIDSLAVNCSPALLTGYLLANGIQAIRCHSSKSCSLEKRDKIQLYV